MSRDIKSAKTNTFLDRGDGKTKLVIRMEYLSLCRGIRGIDGILAYRLSDHREGRPETVEKEYRVKRRDARYNSRLVAAELLYGGTYL